MTFVSLSFTLLFLVVFLYRLSFGRKKVERIYLWVLLLASLLFYTWHVPTYLILILVSTGIDYFAGLALERQSQSTTKRKAILLLSLASFLNKSSMPQPQW